MKNYKILTSLLRIHFCWQNDVLKMWKVGRIRASTLHVYIQYMEVKFISQPANTWLRWHLRKFSLQKDILLNFLFEFLGLDFLVIVYVNKHTKIVHVTGKVDQQPVNIRGFLPDSDGHPISVFKCNMWLQMKYRVHHVIKASLDSIWL